MQRTSVMTHLAWVPEQWVEAAEDVLAGLADPYARLAGIFERVAVSDIAWARTSRWRQHLASLWPGIADVARIKVTGTEAQAHLLAGWLRSRLGREIELEHEPADRLTAVE